jgi:Methyltransferase domain
MSLRNSIISVLRKIGLMGLVARIHQAWLNLIKWICRLQGKSHIEAIYNDSYFAAEEAWTKPSAREVVDIVLKSFSPKSLVDVGCGSAVYLHFFQAAGIEIKGYEGSMAAIQRAAVNKSFIEQCDLTQPIQSSRTYDMAICFEVAEHLPSASADVLVKSLSGLSSLILFSAAQPGQGGVDHINEQPWTHWADKFKAQGYVLDEAMTAKLRKEFGAQGSVWWLEKNMFVVRK